MAPKKRAERAPTQRRLDDFAAAAPPPAPPVALLPQEDEAVAWQVVLAAARAWGVDTRWGVVALAPTEEGLLLHGPRLLFAAKAFGRTHEQLRACWQRLARGADVLLLRRERLEELRAAPLGPPPPLACGGELQAQRRAWLLRGSRAPGPAPLFPPWGESIAADADFDVAALRAWLGLPPCRRHVAFGLRDVPQPLRTREELSRDAEAAREAGRLLRVEDLEAGCEDFVPRPCVR
jgi:hypothetical protein